MPVGTLVASFGFTKSLLVTDMLVVLTILLTLSLLYILSITIQLLALTFLLMCCGRRGMCM